jgi:hypothetical protein
MTAADRSDRAAVAAIDAARAAKETGSAVEKPEPVVGGRHASADLS